MQAKREFILTILAPPLIFLSGFLTYILYHDYGVFTPEVILSMTLISLAGMLAGIPLAIAGPTRFRAFGFAVLLFIFFDIQFDLIDTIYHFLAAENGTLQRYAVFILALFIVQLIILGLHKHIATIITTIFAVTILTTIGLPIQRVSYGAQPVAALNTRESDLPPIIHLVLDGHIGIEGIPRDIEGGAELRELLVGFYERWGFRLYGRAYSKYFLTYNSITNLLNGQASSINANLADISFQNGKAGWKPAQNIYFRQFADAGYRIRVYQNNHIDFCQDSIGEIEYCYRYSSSSPKLLRGTNLPLTEKAELILGNYFDDATIFYIIQSSYNAVNGLLPKDILPTWDRKNYELSSLGVPAVIAHLKMDIASDPRGRLFFAHLLLPHGPYIWDADCQIRKDSDTWLSRRLEHKYFTTFSDEQYRKTAYRYYFQQTTCTVSLLNDLLESLERDGLLDGATVIIHGDHGSRITLADPFISMLKSLEKRDFIDAYSTLFAIRSPTIKPGYIEHVRNIQSLFAENVLDKTFPPEDGKVFLQEGPLTRRSPLESVSMPEF